MATNIGTVNFPTNPEYVIMSGDTWDGFKVVFTDDEGEPIDLTGVSAKLQAKQGGYTYLDVSTDGGTITISENEITVLPILIRRMHGSFSYDLQLTYPSGVVKTRMKGIITVTRDITD